MQQAASSTNASQQKVCAAKWRRACTVSPQITLTSIKSTRLPQQTKKLPKLLEIQHLESPEIARRAEYLAGLLQAYLKD